MKYNFDEIIDRRNSNAMNTDGFREYIFHADSSMEFPYTDEDFVRMWVADMEFATPDVVINGIQRRLDRRIFGYTKVFDPQYYEVFRSWTDSRYGWHCEKQDLLTSNGIIPALYELVEYITKPEEKVMIFTPSYAYFKHAVDFSHRTLVCCDLKEEDLKYSIDFDDMEKKASDPDMRLLILCSPHNPTGRVWTEKELKKIVDICRNHDMYIISDEIHCDLIRKGMTHIPLAKIAPDYEKIITCMAPSKTFNLAGLMFSNIIIPDPKLKAIWLDRHYSFDNPLSVAAAQAAYEEGGEWLDQLQDYLDENFVWLEKFLAANLPEARYRIPEATYLAWVDIGAYLPKEMDIPRFFAFEAGVLLEAGNMFVQNSDTFIRLNLAMPRAMLQKGLERICIALNKERKQRKD